MMYSPKAFFTRKFLSVSVIALGAAVFVASVATPMPGFNSTAFADDGGGQGQGGQGGQGQGGQGQGGQGQGGHGGDGDHGGGHDGEDAADDGGGGGQGGNGQAGEGGNDQAGQGSGGDHQPPWTEDRLLPDWSDMDPDDFELGRLSVARSPDHVLDLALDEADDVLASMADFYNLSLAELQALLSDPATFETAEFLDSPLQNLAIFRGILDGTFDPADFGITASDDMMLAITLAVASDKEIKITPETVYAVSLIFEDPMSETEATALATTADLIRVAIKAGHDG